MQARANRSGRTWYICPVLFDAHAGQSVPTAPGTEQFGQMGVPQRPHARAVSTFG
jgi:hypothetical protein